MQYEGSWCIHGNALVHILIFLAQGQTKDILSKGGK